MHILFVIKDSLTLHKIVCWRYTYCAFKEGHGHFTDHVKKCNILYEIQEYMLFQSFGHPLSQAKEKRTATS